MAKAQRMVPLVVLLAVLVTAFAALQGALGPPRAGPGHPAEIQSATSSPWVLVTAVAIVGLLLLQELLRKDADKRSTMKMQDRAGVEAVRTSDVQVVQVNPEVNDHLANQTSPMPPHQLAIMSEPQYVHGNSSSHGMTRTELEVLLVRAIELSHRQMVPAHSVPYDPRDGTRHQTLIQRRCGAMTAHKVSTMQRMMVEELEASIMIKIGYLSSTFHAWRAEARLERGVQHFENKLNLRQDEWDAALNTERENFQKEEAVLKEREALLSKKWGQKMSLLMDQWACGDVKGLYIAAFRAWHARAKRAIAVRAHMRSTQKVGRAAMGPLLKWIDGDAKGAAHNCFLRWKAEAARTMDERDLERRIKHANDKHAEECRNWEKLLADKEISHDDDLRLYMSKEELRRQKAHEVTELMLAKWLRGDANGLLATIVLEWKRCVMDIKALHARRQSVHVSVLRFLDGEQVGLMQACFLNWKSHTKEQLLHKNEVSEHQRTITELQERARSHLGHEQLRLLKYSAMFASQDMHSMGLMVLAAWRLEAKGLAAEDIRRRQEIELEERKRMHDLAVTKHRHHLAAVLSALGVKDDGLLVLDAFTAWSQIYQAEKLRWAHQLAANDAAEKYAKFILDKFAVRDKKSLLAAYFWEFTRQIRREIHEKDREDAAQWLEEKRVTITRELSEEIARLKAALHEEHVRIDKINETLQKELKVKDELTDDLNEAIRTIGEQSLVIESRVEVKPAVEERTTRRTRHSATRT